jgi:hypothetical protein
MRIDEGHHMTSKVSRRRFAKVAFGIVHVDFKTQKRTPNASAQLFRATAVRNSVV